MNKQQLANKIWESANKMRSKIEANEYKDYILGFIFYKYLSDQEVKFLKENDFAEDDIKAVSEEDPETVEYIQQNIGYFIAYENLFSTWLELGRDFDVSNVRDALSAFSRLIHNSHKKVFENVFRTLETGLSKLGDSSGTQTKAISGLLQLIKEIPMDGKQDYDVLGFIYEYLIEKNKVSIYDIPIVLITEQYLEYVNQMDHEDLDVVSDFLVMAATLLDIKSRMLLPKVEKEEEEDEEDPRAELVRRLLEYKMYKYMAQELEEREQEAELLFFKEPTIPREVAKYEEPLDLDKLLDGLTLAKLQKVFDAVMKRNANKLDPVRSRFSTIRREPISLEQKVRSVLSYAREHRHFKFSDVLERESDRLEIVVAFLAVLELMKMGRIHLVQEKLFDEMQLDTVDVDETEGEAELELSTEEGEEYARIR